MFNRILVGVDGHAGGRDAIALATQLAEPEAELTIAHIADTRLMPRRGAAMLLAIEIEESRRLLKEEQDLAGVEATRALWADHNVGRGLHELAADWNADLLVIGSSHRGRLGSVFPGDSMRQSLNGAPCAVAVAPHGYTATIHAFETIGVGYDGSSESEWALKVGRDVAHRFDASVCALAVISPESIRDGKPTPDDWPEFATHLVDSERRRVDALAEVDGEVRYGDPSKTLARFAEQLDLLVVGSRSYGAVARMFNPSTSNYLACRAPCPLLVVPRTAMKINAIANAPQAQATPR
jgi:nucleotide-binding universal stress UspA family protein